MAWSQDDSRKVFPIICWGKRFGPDNMKKNMNYWVKQKIRKRIVPAKAAEMIQGK